MNGLIKFKNPASEEAISFINEELFKSNGGQLAIPISEAKKLLQFLESQINFLYHENRDWAYIGKRLQFIVKHDILFHATGCASEIEYIRNATSRLGMSSDLTSKYLKAYRTYLNYESYFRTYDCDIHFNAEALAEKRLFSKLLILDKAMEIKINSHDLLYPYNETFKHFLNDSLRDFKAFIDPSSAIKEKYKQLLKKYRKNIKEEAEKFEQVHILSFPSNHKINREELIKLINSIKGDI